MFEKVRDMLAEALNISAEKITMDSNVIEDLGADSLDMVELLSRLEDEEGITIPEEDLDGLTTVGDIVRELEKIVK
ncbi:MAG: acyl carrier protein [Christensenellaceae bacterium]|jgi:acyl carrier protein|nr:acyl carrier protein [Bacillota bacterium]